MLDLSPEKIFVVGVVALVVLGPDRLPSAARTLGRWIGQLRSMSSSFQAEVRDALHEPGDAVIQAMGDLRPGQVRRSVRDAITTTLAPTRPGPGPHPTGEGPWGAAPRTGHPDDPSLN